MSDVRRLVVQPEAIQETNDAFTWYSSRDPRIAERFRSAIEAAIQEVFNAPLRWPMYDEDVRHYSVRRFPYRIVYLVEDQTVHIVAIAHYRQRPGYWRDRL